MKISWQVLKMERNVTDFEKGKLRAELYADKNKFLIGSLISVLFAIISVICAQIFFEDEVIKNAASVSVSVVVFFLILERAKYIIFKSPHLKLYDQHLEIRDLGVWTLDEIGGHAGEDKIIFTLKCEGRNMPLKVSKKIAYFYKYYPEKNIVLAGFEFPWRLSNISTHEFHKNVYRYAPGDHKKPEHLHRKSLERKTWKTWLLGGENPSRKDWIKNILIYIAIILFGYIMFGKHNFFPSSQWKSISSVITYILIILGSALYYYAYWKGKIKLAENTGRISRWASLLFIPISIWMASYVTIELAIAKIHTEYFGQPATKIIMVIKDNDVDKYCFDSEELGTGFLKELCVNKTFYISLPRQKSLLLSGKESSTGFIVNDMYSLNLKTETPPHGNARGL
jgi:hypothetical protein